MARKPATHSRKSADRDAVQIEASGAIRGLAHPARLAIVDELYQGNERTASELARLTDLSPSAMSYHLRALARWGYIERGEARTDARERPWRAPARSLSLVSDQDSAAAADVIAAGYLRQLHDELRRWRLVAGEDRERWPGAGVRRSFLWLSEDEFQALSSELDEVVERHADDRHAGAHPEGSRRILCVIALAPEAAES